MGRKRRRCSRSYSQRKVDGENSGWSTGEEEEEWENVPRNSKNGSNRAKSKIKVEIQSENEVEGEKCKKNSSNGKKQQQPKRSSGRKRVLTQVNRNTSNASANSSLQLKSPSRKKYALSVSPKKLSSKLSSSKKSPPTVSILDISGLSPISPVPISVYDSETNEFGGSVGSPSKLGGSVGSPSKLGGSVGSPSKLGGSVGSPSKLGRSVGSPSKFGGLVGSPSKLGRSVGSPSKFGEPLKSSTPKKKINSDLEDSMFVACISPATSQEKKKAKDDDDNVENKENEPPKRKRGRPPGKKKKPSILVPPKKSSATTGAKRGRKPKLKIPLLETDSTNKQSEETAKVTVQLEPVDGSKVGEFEVVLDSDQNPDTCPMLCLVNNDESNLVIDLGPEEDEKVEVFQFTSVVDPDNPDGENIVQLEINYAPTKLPSTPTRRQDQLDQGTNPQQDNEVDVKVLSPIAINSQMVVQEKSSNFIVASTNPVENSDYCNSPVFLKVILNDSEEELDSSNCEARSDEHTPHRYKLRPRRKLFPQALALHRYQPDSENEDSEEEFVLYVTDDSEEEDDDEDSACSDEMLENISIENTDNNEPRKSSYQGGRGPRADLKALSLVTNCPVSVKWLMDNFEYHQGKSLPRGFVYDQYVLLCDQHGLEPVNAASFGKLIRSVFPGLKTRRLGTRGNSKYHYNGVYLKPTSPLRTLFNALRTQQGLMYDGGKRGRRVRKPMDQEMLRELLGIDEADDIPSDLPPEDYLGKKTSRSYSSLIIDPAQIPDGITEDDLAAFEKISHEHVSRLLNCFENFDLRGVTEELQRFWRVKCSDPNSQNRAPYKQLLPRVKLFKMCTMPCVENFIKSMDLFLYQGAIEILFPYLTREMPVTMHQGMRNFVKEIEIVMHKVLNGYPMKMCDLKMRCLRVFVSMWHDYSRLNKQVKSTCQILRSNESLRVMRSEFEKSVKVKEAAMEEKDTLHDKSNTFSFIVNLIVEFSVQLKDQEQSIESWVEWAQSTTQKLLKESCRLVDSKEVAFPPNAVEFWKAASDQVMGALAKWGNISVPHFKTFLSWIDHLISHLYKLVIATSDGFPQPSFYYFDHWLQPSTVPTIPRQMVVKVHDKGPNPGKKGRVPRSTSGTIRRRRRKELADKVEPESTNTDSKKDEKNTPEVGQSNPAEAADITDAETQLVTESDLLSFLDDA